MLSPSFVRGLVSYDNPSASNTVEIFYLPDN